MHKVVCKTHPDRPAEKYCAICGSDFCKECLVQMENEMVCVECAKTKKAPGWSKFSKEWKQLPKFRLLYSTMFKLLEKGFWTLFGTYALGTAIQFIIIFGVFFIAGGGELLQKMIASANTPDDKLVNEMIQFFKNSLSIFLTGGFVYFLSVYWTMATTLIAIDSVDKDKNTPFGSILLQGTIKMVPAMIIGILYIALVCLGFVMLIIPGILFGVWYLFVFSSIILENTHFVEAFKRSRKLTKGFFWAINGRYGWFVVVAWLWMIAIGLIGKIPIVGPIVSQAGNILVGLLGLIFYYLIYQKLCDINGAPGERKPEDDAMPKIETSILTKTMFKGGAVILIAAIISATAYFTVTFGWSYIKLAQLSSRSKDMAAATEQFSKVYDITLLKRALGSGNIYVKKAAIERLSEIGDPKLAPIFVKMFDREKDIQMKSSIIIALCRVGDSTSVPKIREALKHPNPVIRISAAQALGEKSDLASLEYIVQMLNDSDETVRVAACEALRKFNNSTVVAPLRGALKDPSPNVRIAALSALCKIGGVKFIGPSMELLADPDPEVRDSARIQVKRQMCELTMDKILYEIRMGEKLVKIELLAIVGDAGEKSAMNSVVTCLYEKDTDLRLAAIDALNKIGDKRILSSLKPMLKREKNKKVKEALAELISNLSKPAKGAQGAQRAQRAPNTPKKAAAR
ncbi:MAG: hypothetical protein A2297_04140 [Elusimicrobia bacterium RIFOXYB2_FULL_48_7]|nr:MAG: hypothetical protein A2297_04140 [Elusimicrobia bacterium RIFOXYB2_FULL_48_7]